MILKNKIPSEEGYYMPGEFEQHHGCIMVWPERPGSWPYEAKGARKSFKQVILAIAKSEHVYVAASNASIEDAKMQLSDVENVTVFHAETDDAWARDIGPTFVLNKNTMVNGNANVRGINWSFNAWGGDFNGLYAHWDQDDAFAKTFMNIFGFDIYDATPFVLEGGSIHSDGEGTVMVTETCLLSSGRNPRMSKQDIENHLKNWLGAKKVLWLPCGIYLDETDEHVDNICAFIRPGEVVLAWTDNENDPQYAMSKACLDYLNSEVDAMGRKIKVHLLPIPDIPVCVQEEDLLGYAFEEGEDMREAGDRLAASYVNFYFSNEAIVLPAFGGENKASDDRAAALLAKWCPEREIIQIDAMSILLGGGNIHCITQQIPKFCHN